MSRRAFLAAVRNSARMISALFVPYADAVLTFNRAAGSTDAVDVSGYRRKVTFSGSIVGGGRDGNAYQPAALGAGVGSGNFVGLDNDPDLVPLARDFTVEVWFNLQEYYGYQPIITKPGAGDGNGLACGLSPGNNLGMLVSSGGGWSFYNENASGISLGWHHIAISRQGAQWRLFLDGNIIYAPVIGLTVGGDTQGWRIGNYPYYPGGSRSSTGQFDNFELNMGEAKYTANFTPPAAPPLALRPDTSMLLRFHGADGSSRFIDESPNNVPLAYSGTTPTISNTAVSGRRGVLVAHATGRLQGIALNEAVVFEGDFTIEVGALIPAIGGHAHTLFDFRPANPYGGVYLGLDSGSGKWVVVKYGTPVLVSDAAATLGSWVDLAVQRVGGNWTLFVNGVAQAATFSNGAVLGNGSMVIADAIDFGAAMLDGYLSHLVVTKKSVAPRAYPGVLDLRPTDAVVLHMQGPNADQQFVDSSNNNYPVATHGDTRHDTSVSKFGKASAYFDGTAYLQMPGAGFEPGASDFTLQAWINTTSGTTYGTVISKGNGSFNNGSWTLMHRDGSGVPAVYCHDGNAGAGPWLEATGYGVDDGAWHHLAWVRHGLNHYLFVDGVIRATATGGASLTPNGYDAYIGCDASFGGRDFVGHMQELRFNATTALWTANFTPPLRPSVE